VIGLYLVSLVFDLLGIITRKKEYVTFAFIMLIFSGISVLFALASGVLEEYTIIIPQAAESTFETHETLAFVTASLILLQVFWRIGLKNRLQGKTRMIFLALAIAGLISLFIGTYLGGKLVYRYGTGIRYEEPVSGKPTPEPTDAKKKSKDDLFYPAKDSLGSEAEEDN
jgi:uncharacterized membrane protein